MRRKRTLLVYPLQGGVGAFIRHVPTGLLYTSSSLVKNGEDVELFDCRLHAKDWPEKLRLKISSETLLVGVSVMSGTPVLEATKICNIVKALDPEIKTVVGGPHATFNAESILENDPNCDFVINGYGSEALTELVSFLQGAQNLENVPALLYRSGSDKIVSNPKIELFENIDWRDIPYHLIEDYDAYGQLGGYGRIFSMYSSLGCPYQCTFCSSPAQYRSIQGKKWIPLEARTVVDHIQYLVENYQADFIYFYDDDSFVKLSHVEAIMDEIKLRDIKVKLGFRGARINEIKKMTDDFIEKLIDAGTDVIHVGAESGSDRILKLVKKNCTAADIIECNQKLARHPRMKTAYNFMMGAPTETLEDLEATRNLILKITEDHPNAIVMMPNRFRPLANTELYDLAIENGYSPPKNNDEWGEVEIESVHSLPWITKDMKKTMDLLLVGSYFVDHKASRIAVGKSLLERLVRLADRIYGPIGRWRMRTGNTFFLVEIWFYRVANRLMKKFTTRINDMGGEAAEGSSA